MNNIRQRPIPWDGAVRAGTINEDQLSKIRAVDKVRKEQRKQTVEADLHGYRTLFVGSGDDSSVLESATKAKRPDVVQYILALLADLLDGMLPKHDYLYSSDTNRSLAGIPALSRALSEHPEPFKPFLPLLTQSQDPESAIPLLTSTVVTKMISSSSGLAEKATTAMPKLLSYLSTLAKSSDGGLQDIAVLDYSALLQGKRSRKIFWDQRKDTISPLIDILRAAAGVANGDSASTLWSGNASIRTSEGTLGGGVGLQLLYHVLLVLWQLSFEGATIGEGLEE